MKTEITKSEAIELFGSVPKLAKALGVTRSAIYQWPDDKPIPKDKALMIRFVIRPKGLKPAASRDAEQTAPAA